MNAHGIGRALLAFALTVGDPSLVGQASSSSLNFTLIKDAAQAIAEGNLGHAEADLQTVLRGDPNEYRALNLLGVVRAQQHREPEAEQLFEQAIKQRPDFASAYVDLGLLYVQLNRSGEAVAEFQQALHFDPSRADARSSLIAIYKEQAKDAVQSQDSEKALAILIQARKLSPQDPDVLFEFGMVALRMSLFSDAIEAFEKTLQQRTTQDKALYGLGRAQIGMTKFQDAEETFARYLKMRPDDASGHYAMGLVLRALEQGPAARREFETSLQLQPRQTESYDGLGLLDLDENNLADASRDFHEALKSDSRNAGALIGLGRVAFQQKQYQSAADYLKQAVASDPSAREAHYYLGMAYGRMGRAEDSQKELQTARQLDQEEVQKQHSGLKILTPQDPK